MFQRILTDIAEAFTSAQIPYIVIGGQALLLYGDLRMTKDIDITLGVDIDNLDKVVDALPPASFELLGKDYRTFARQTRVLPIKDVKTSIRIDLIFSFSPFEQLAIQRANLVSVGSTTVAYASLEDMLIFKMVAGRPRDLEDVHSMLNRNSHYDTQYVRQWLTEFENVIDRNLTQDFLRLADKID